MRKIKPTTGVTKPTTQRDIKQLFEKINTLLQTHKSEDHCEIVLELMEKIAASFSLEEQSEAKNFEYFFWQLGNEIKNIAHDCHDKVAVIIRSLDQVYYPENFSDKTSEQRKISRLTKALATAIETIDLEQNIADALKAGPGHKPTKKEKEELLTASHN